MNHPAVKPIPVGMHSLTPYLVCRDAEDAIAFYEKAFRAVVVSRLANDNGRILNAQMKIGDSLMMLMDEFVQFAALGPKTLGGSPVTLHLQVTDVDDVFKSAVAAGASIKMPIKEEFWGDRMGIVEDPFGHNWSIATRVREVNPEEQREHAAKAMNV